MLWNFRGEIERARHTNRIGPWYCYAYHAIKHDGQYGEQRVKHGTLHSTVQDYKHLGQTSIWISPSEYTRLQYKQVIFRKNPYKEACPCGDKGGDCFPDFRGQVVYNTFPCIGTFDVCILPDSFIFPKPDPKITNNTAPGQACGPYAGNGKCLPGECCAIVLVVGEKGETSFIFKCGTTEKDCKTNKIEEPYYHGSPCLNKSSQSRSSNN